MGKRCFSVLGLWGTLFVQLLKTPQLPSFFWHLRIFYMKSYHPVVTDIALERSSMLLIGKPSVSMGHLFYTMAMLNNQRVLGIQCSHPKHICSKHIIFVSCLGVRISTLIPDLWLLRLNIVPANGKFCFFNIKCKWQGDWFPLVSKS